MGSRFTSKTTPIRSSTFLRTPNRRCSWFAYPIRYAASPLPPRSRPRPKPKPQLVRPGPPSREKYQFRVERRPSWGVSYLGPPARDIRRWSFSGYTETVGRLPFGCTSPFFFYRTTHRPTVLHARWIIRTHHRRRFGCQHRR